MKKLCKHILIALSFIVCFTSNSYAFNPCGYDTRLYICKGSTTDIDAPSFGQKLINTVSYTGEEVNKLTNAMLLLDQKNSMESQADTSGSEVPNLNLSASPLSSTNPISVTLQGSSNISVADLDAPSMAMSISEDKVAQYVIYYNMIKADSSIAASETLMKNRETFFVSGIFESFAIAYDAQQKLSEIYNIIPTALKAAENDEDFNANIRYRHAISQLNTSIRSQIIKLQGARTLEKLRRDLYLSPNYITDSTSAINAGTGSSTGYTEL